VQAAQSKGPGIVKRASHRLKQWRKDQPELFKREPVSFGTIAGGDCLKTERQLHHELATVATKLGSYQQQLYTSQSDEWTDERIAATLKDLRQLVSRALEAAIQIEFLNLFSRPENLKKISEWTIADAKLQVPRYDEAIDADGRTLRNRQRSPLYKREMTFRNLERLVLPELQKLAASLSVNTKTSG
jgi:hypothetical protein